MRIAITHTRFTDFGGVERYIRVLVDRLLSRPEYEVHYFCNKWDEEPEGLHLHKVPNHFKPIRTLKVLGFDKHSERMVREAGPFDIVHGFTKTSRQDIYTDGSGCLEDYQAYSLSKSPLKQLFGRYSPHQRAVLAIERKRFTRGNFKKIVTMSELVANQIRTRYGLNEEEVEVVYNGIDLERFHPRNVEKERETVRKELGIDSSTPLFLFLGSDFTRKGLDTFLEALKIMGKGQAIIIGKERPKVERAFQTLARDLGVADRVAFLGLKPNPAQFFAASDCFVLPTRFDAFGMVVLEGMATGIPTVVSKKAGAAEVVRHGETGAIFEDPDDPGELAAAMTPFLDLDHCRISGKAARVESEQYDWDSHFDRILEIYGEISANKSQSLVK